MKLNINILVLLILIFGTLTGCNNQNMKIIGEYEFEEVICVGGLSSYTRDALFEHKKGTKYIINNNSLSILGDQYNITYSNISYKKEVVDDEFIKTNFSITGLNIIDVLNQYKEKYRYYIYDEEEEIINLYIFLMDGEVFIGYYDESGILLSSLDKLKLINRP